MKNIKVTCISENTISMGKRLLGSHGQSLLLEIDEKKYVFDTSEIYEGFIYNLELLNLKLEDIDSIILSHNHLDHSGALFKLVDTFIDQKLYLPPDMMQINEEKYTPHYRTVEKDAAIQRLLNYKNTIIITESQQFEENMYTTGPLEAMDKEQSIVLNIPDKGLVILVGCAHPTLPVIIEKAKQVSGSNQIYGIIGGLHYVHLTEEELRENMKFIASLDPEFIIPSHCTGFRAVQVMQEVLGEKVHVSSVGGQFGSGSSVTILPELQFSLS